MAETAARTPHAWRPERFMVIVAHPDDADFGPAATAASWIDAGSQGWLVCCTSGDAGADDWQTDPIELAALREAEQRAAADVVGYAGITFLHQPDGALANDLALREQLVREIREWAREEGAAIGVDAAEAHRVIVIEDDEDEGPQHGHEPETASATDPA